MKTAAKVGIGFAIGAVLFGIGWAATRPKTKEEKRDDLKKIISETTDEEKSRVVDEMSDEEVDTLTDMVTPGGSGGGGGGGGSDPGSSVSQSDAGRPISVSDFVQSSTVTIPKIVSLKPGNILPKPGIVQSPAFLQPVTVVVPPKTSLTKLGLKKPNTFIKPLLNPVTKVSVTKRGIGEIGVVMEDVSDGVRILKKYNIIP